MRYQFVRKVCETRILYSYVGEAESISVHLGGMQILD